MVEATQMIKILRLWLRSLRYRGIVRELRELSAAQLSALWIRPADIDRLALKVAVLR
jgi:uncharacterized protein YjiS (DUF1127 family)